MKRNTGILVGFVIALVVISGIAATPIFDTICNAVFTFDTGSVLNLNGTWKIDGTEVTATAAELNNSALVDKGIQRNVTNGTSVYRVYENYGTSTVISSITRTDFIHSGNEANLQSTNAPAVGEYVSIGRAVNYNAGANWSGGTLDTAARWVAINKATNDSAYGIRGGYVKVKNYDTGTVGPLEGLFVEAVNDGTAGSLSEIVLKLGTDNTTIDYGINMDLCTIGTADILFPQGAKVRNGTAGTITWTCATNSFVGLVDATDFAIDTTNLTVSAAQVNQLASGFTGVITNGIAAITNVCTFTNGVLKSVIYP